MVRKLHLKADKVLEDAERALPFSLVNPENADSIKRKFLKNPYNPEFSYATRPDTQPIREKLEKLKFGRGKAGKLLKAERDHILAKSRMADLIGTPYFPEACEEVYGVPDKQLVKKAEQLVKLTGSPKGKRIKADQVKQIMRYTFKLLGFSYALKRKKMIASAAVSPGSQTVTLRAKERFDKLYTYRLAVHEIGTHALRAENGRQQDIPIFSRGTPGYLATEEGLAVYNEERAGVMTIDILRNYAGRVLAVDYARRHTFIETYQYLTKWFDKQAAYKLAMRAKRGLPDGEHLGACTKDHVYLKGYLAIKEYVAGGNSLHPLYAGKIGLEDLDAWGKHLKDPAYFPEPVIEWIRSERLTEQ